MQARGIKVYKNARAADGAVGMFVKRTGPSEKLYELERRRNELLAERVMA